MRFYVYGFNQQVLFEKYNNLNGNDVIVLRVMVDMIPRLTRTLVVENNEFTQVTYDLLLQDVPFVTQSISTLKKIVQKLVDTGLIERHIVNKGGKFTYFRVTEKLNELQQKPREKKLRSDDKANQGKGLDSKINNRSNSSKVIQINKRNSFNNFQQRKYSKEDFRNMERLLLKK